MAALAKHPKDIRIAILLNTKPEVSVPQKFIRKYTIS
jgi:hypothetical protein